MTSKESHAIPLSRNLRAWVLCMGLAYIAVRLGYTILMGAVESVEPAWRTLFFFLIASIVLWTPGLFLWKKSKLKTLNPYLPVVFVLATSMGANMMALWIFYACGIYTKFTASVFLLLLAASGLFALSHAILHPFRYIRAFFKRAQSIPLLDVFSIMLCLLFVGGIFDYVFGSSIADGDALVSWDKWANDIARRNGIGGYVVGAYPQGIPLINSLFYKFIEVSKPICSIEHQYIKCFMTSYELLLCFSVLSFGHRLKLPGIIPLMLFFGNAEVFSHAVTFLGYVDLPFASICVAMCAVLLLIYEKDNLPRGISWRHIAAWSAVFGTLFSKGNGFAYLLLMTFICWKSVDDKWRSRMWEYVTPPLFVAGSFVLHQCWFGLFAQENRELSPFLHVMDVRVAHTNLFEPSLEHAKMWMSKLSEWYGMADSRIAYAVIATFILLTVVSLGLKHLRFFGLLGLGGVSLWFFTGSYDFRNAFLPLLLVLIAVTGACFSTAQTLRGKCIRSSGCMFLLLCALLVADARRLHHVCMILPRLPSVRRELALSPQERRLKHLKWGLAGDMFVRAPYMLRAKHIIQYGTESRFIGEHGVFGGRLNAYNEGSPHDLAITIDNWNRIRNPPCQYVPISGFLRKGHLAAFHMLSPEITDISSRVNIDGSPLNTNNVFGLKQVHQLKLNPVHAAMWPESQRDGYLAVTIAPPDSDVRITLAEPDRSRDPFSPYLCSTNDTGTVKLLYWMETKGSPFPEFDIASENKPFSILNVSWGR